MNQSFPINDLTDVIEADRAHVWHHLIQHKRFETRRPARDGRGQGDAGLGCARARSISTRSRAGSGRSMWAMAARRIADAVRDQLVKMNYFAGSGGLDPRGALCRGADREDAGADPGLLLPTRARRRMRRSSRWCARSRRAITAGASRRSSTASGIITAPPSPRCRPAGSRSGPCNTGPSRRALSRCRIASNTASNGTWRTMAERAADAIEEVILREGPDTIGALCLEPVTAGGGVIVPPEGYWERVQEICREVRHPAPYRRGGLRRRAAPGNGSAIRITASSPIS